MYAQNRLIVKPNLYLLGVWIMQESLLRVMGLRIQLTFCGSFNSYNQINSRNVFSLHKNRANYCLMPSMVFHSCEAKDEIV